MNPEEILTPTVAMTSDEVLAFAHSAIAKYNSDEKQISLTDDEFAAMTICQLESVRAMLREMYDEGKLDLEFEAADMALNHEIHRLESREKTWLKP
jgi:hypothetical protein